MDVHSKSIRSKNMKAIKNRDTAPELLVRRLLHKNGYRYRIAPTTKPGKPDIWMAKWNTSIFINGCFWYMHNCDRFKLPEERQELWKEKLLKNKNRDMEKVKQLHDLGVRVLVIWECSLIGKKKIRKETIMTLIKTFLFTSYRAAEITPNGLTIIY